MVEESQNGRLDNALSVELKRLNAMLATYNELLNAPQAKTAMHPRSEAGVISQILISLGPNKRSRKQPLRGD